MLRKWEYIARALRNMKAPSKVINAAQELDNILVSLGLDYNTSYWAVYESENKYQDEYLGSLCSIIYNATYCTACFDINNEDVNCSDCALSKGMGKYMGKYISCTPRSLYADDYYKIVTDYVVSKC
jgi:hypothetical protein